MPSKEELGARIKRYRLEKNYTLKDVEVKAGVSATHVSEIERGMTSPTVGALKKIARALGTEPAYFLEENAYPQISVVRKADRRHLVFSEWGAKIVRLSKGVRDGEISFLEVELEPGVAQPPEPVAHTGESLVTIMKGVVEVTVASSRHLLKEGDSLHFDASHPHTMRNIGDGPARVLWVTSPPMFL